MSGGERRTLGLLHATGLGVGAIVGGGVLALAGVAFQTTGPSTVLAFALNGAIAFVTALSFAELASRFPQSGGVYTYARKVLTIESAFGVGWVTWFAFVVAAVLYALGFSVFFAPILSHALDAVGVTPPAWIDGRFALIGYALASLAVHGWSLLRSETGGGQWTTIGKVVLFGALIGGGFWRLAADPPPAGELLARFTPFFENGASGLAKAMGYTFITLHGFDLIAAVGGRVRDPERTIPRAMFLSLTVSLLIYLPLMFLVVAIGTPGRSVAVVAAENPEILVAEAARTFLGLVGYWLVIVAGALAMLSAMQANLLGAVALARTMAADRTLPRAFGDATPGTSAGGAPVKLTALTVALVLVAVPDLAAAGAASSLIFLATFALAHGIAYLTRRRAQDASPFSTWAFPLVPIAGGVTCLALALYEALAVPSAGVLTALWLGLGAILYTMYLAPVARAVDASSEALDPQLIRLRGRTPVVLVPIANPENAATLVKVAEAIAPKGVSRIQLLTVIRKPALADDAALPPPLVDAQRILGGALSTALAADLRPEALVTIHDDPWSEIGRLAERSRCETVLLGVGSLGRDVMSGPLERLIERISADVVVLRAPNTWSPDDARRILVPSRLGREQSAIRARLLGSLARSAPRETTFLGIVPPGTPAPEVRRAELLLRRLARDEASGGGDAVVVPAADTVTEVVARAAACDLMILGLRAQGRRRVFGETSLAIAEATTCPLLMISHRA